MENKLCELCNHSLENNSHGIDQNDMYYEPESGDWKHSGTCTYCAICNPSLLLQVSRC